MPISFPFPSFPTQSLFIFFFSHHRILPVWGIDDLARRQTNGLVENSYTEGTVYHNT